MFKKIFVPLDGTPESEPALEAAADVATLCGSEVVLGRVLFAPESLSNRLQHLVLSNQTAIEEHPACDYVEQQAARLRSRGLVVHTALLHDHSVEAGLDHLLEMEQPQLIVMTAHRKEGLRRHLAAAVSDHLIATAGCPVLVTGERALHQPHFQHTAAVSSRYRNK